MLASFEVVVCPTFDLNLLITNKQIEKYKIDLEEDD